MLRSCESYDTCTFTVDNSHFSFLRTLPKRKLPKRGTVLNMGDSEVEDQVGGMPASSRRLSRKESETSMVSTTSTGVYQDYCCGFMRERERKRERERERERESESERERKSERERCTHTHRHTLFHTHTYRENMFYFVFPQFLFLFFS